MRVFDSRKTLAFGLILLVSTLVVHAVVPTTAPAVKDVAMTTSGDLLEARISITSPARVTYFELTKPRRLVVDFHELENGLTFKQKQVSAAGVERVRAEHFQDKDRDTTRIVFDLTDDAKYRVVDEKSQLVRVLFGTPGAAVPVPSKVEPATKGAPPVLVAEVSTAPSIVASPLAAPVQVPASLQLQPLIAAPVVASSPSRFNLQPLTLSAQDITAPQMAAVAQPVPALMMVAAMPPTPVGAPPQIVVSAPQAPGGTLTGSTQTPYTGEIVSFDVRDLELKDFFRLISETSGLNIALDQNVTGTLPMLRLTDVPWDQALDLVLKQNQLSGVLQGTILRIATNATMQAEGATQKAQLDAKDAVSETVTHTYVLNYTKAETVEATLKNSLSKRGEIFHDNRKNAVIVTDLPSQFGKVDQMVAFLDTAQQQVEIEGRLLSADKSFSRDLGAQLGLLVGANTGNVLTGGSGATSPLVVTNGATPRVASGSGIPLLSNLPAAATSGLAFLLQPGGNVLLDAIVTAAEANGKAKLLSAPRITTQNNQPATVTKGTQIPVQSSVNNTVSVSFINFALNLTVTPQITAAGTVLLTVQLENSVPDFARTVNGIPSVATQMAKTQVLIPDGGTAVIGGIYIDTDSLNIRQVPGFGSIPVLGHLFKETQTLKSTSELIFFVTPKIKSLDQIVAAVPDPRAEPQR
jgi:type IV pilus assembly protein PilQ